MPNIKTFDAANVEAGVPLRANDEGADAANKAGRYVEQQYASAGQEIGSHIAAYQTLTESTALAKGMSDIEVQQAKDMADARQNMTPAQLHDPNYVSEFMGKYDDAKSQLGDNIGMPAVKEQYQRAVSENTARVSQSFIGMQAKAQADDTMGKADAYVNNQSILASMHPENAQVYADQNKEYSKNMLAGDAAKWLSGANNHLYDTSADVMIGKIEGAKVYDPAQVDAMQAYLKDPKNGFVGTADQPGMSADAWTHAMNRLDAVRRSGANTSIAGAELNFPAMINQVKIGGDISGDLKTGIDQLNTIGASGGPGAAEALSKAAVAEQDIQNAQAFYRANQGVVGTPISGRQKSLADSEAAFRGAVGGANIATAQSAHDANTAAWKERDEAFNNADPGKRAEWVNKNIPSVQLANAAFQAHPDANTFFKYAQASYGTQMYLDPGKMPSLVTPEMTADAQKFVNQILRNPDPKVGPNSAVDGFTKLNQLYGQFAPSIFGDLRKKGVFNGSEAVLADWSTDPASRGFVQQGALASRATDAQLDVLSPKKTYAEALIDVAGELGDLPASMNNINNKAELLGDNAELLAKMVRYTGTDASTLVGKLLGNKFVYTGADNSIRLPAAMSADADAIGAGSKHVLDHIEAHDLVIPPGMTGLGSQNVQKYWQERLQANGKWHIAPDGKGAILYDPFGNAAMENKNGNAVALEVGWAKLKEIGSQSPATKKQIDATEAAAFAAGGGAH